MNELINNYLTALNGVGRGFWDYAAGIFIQSGILIIMLLIIDFLLRKRVRAIFRYCVWMLVFVKLVLPPSLCLPTGIGYWFGDYLSTDSPVLERPSNIVQHEPVGASAPGDFALSIGTPEVEPSQTIPEMVAPATSAVSSLPPLTWQAFLFLLWLVGVLVISVLLIQRMSFVKGLVAQSEPAKNRLLDVLNECRRQVGIRRNIELRLSNNISGPAVCGLFKPTILVPTALLEKIPPDKLRTVLIHELAHIKRGDLWVNSMQTFLQIIYFYNPFVWLANVVVRRIREQAVDEMVLVALGAGAKSYSNTLIDIAEMAFWRTSLSLRFVGVVESKKALHRRIRHMLSRPIPKSAKIGIASLLIVIIAGAILLPMAAAATEKKKPQFMVELPNGVSVHLVGVCDWPEEGRRCWRPDGSQLPVKIYATKRNKSPAVGDYGFMFKVNGPDDLNFSWNKIFGASGWEGSCRVVDAQGNQLEGFEAAISDMKEGQLSTTIRVGIATGPWTTIASHDGRRMDSGRQGGVLWSQAFEANNGTHIVASSEWRKDRAERVVAIDKEGILHRTGHGSVASGKIDQLTASFRDLKLWQIEKFSYQTRPYTWATFTSVSLQPGVRTDVQGEAEGEATAPQKIFDGLPNIFIMEPSQKTFSIFNEVVSLSQDWVWNKMGRQHNKKFYDEIFDATHNRTAGDMLVLVFSLDREDRIPTEYEDLLPKPWPEIEAELKQGRTVELLGKARELNVILLAAPKMDQLKKVIAASNFLNNPKSFIKTGGKGCDVGIENFKIQADPDRGVYTACVSIRNFGKIASPKFIVNFCRGDPKAVKPMTHGAGPIEPGGVWNERSSAFGLKDGANEILIVLDPANLVEELDESNNRALLRVIVRDGRVIEESRNIVRPSGLLK